MTPRTVTADDLARLKGEREAADRAYNEALSALDAAIAAPPALPAAAPGPDTHQAAALNASWAIADAMAAGAPAADARGWLSAKLWGLVAPFVAGSIRDALTRQQAFNAHLVDHLNRNAERQQATADSIAAAIGLVGDQARALGTFQSRLVVFLQQVTPFVDTKDHEFAALARRLYEDNREVLEWITRRTEGLGGSISGVGDELAKRWETTVVRERRYEAHATRLEAAFEDMRSSLAVMTQGQLALKRELERRGADLATLATLAAAPLAAVPGPAGASPSFQQAAATTIDSYKYVGFEDRFRGSRDDVRARLETYLPLFEGARDVLDVGCGRGEFIELLHGRGIGARGLDLNHEMVEVCRAKGLDVAEGEALGHLQSLPDASLGGLFAAQVVEHLQPDYLIALLDTAYHKLRPGSTLVLETINPACWFAFFSSYIRDLTHVRPVHPDTLAYFVQASGFQRVRVEYRVPFPEHEKLQPLPDDVPGAVTFNRNVRQLNGLLFSHFDYAAIAERL